MNNILITGSNGQLGNEIRVLSKKYPDFNFFFTDVEELDITDKAAIERFVSENKISHIINCAAYTAVDKAEEEKDLASKINVEAVKNLALVSKAHNALLIHISTDYVFDGKNYKPYLESDPIAPQSHYAFTKAEAERAIREISGRAIIIRTSWLYSSFGKNFVKTMIKLGNERDELKVVRDQIGTPTYALDLAEVSLKFIADHQATEVEIYNFSNEGVCSWYDFAKEIMEIKNIDCKIIPIESKDYPTPAVRPFYSVFNKTKITQTLPIEIPHWKDSLKQCLNLLKD